MIVNKEPYITSEMVTTENLTIFSGTNTHIKAHKYGNVVTVQIFNVKPSVIVTSSSVQLPSRMRPTARVDASIGWIWKSGSGSKPLMIQLLDNGTFASPHYYDNSTGLYEDATDADGNIFGTVTYVVG